MKNNDFILYGDSGIFLYGCPRSGGTLIYNIIRYLYDDNIRPQQHKFFQLPSNTNIILIYRNFLDAAVSQWRTQYNPPYPKATFNHIRGNLNNFKDHATILQRYIDNYKHTLLLKYESFVHNFNYIYNSLETFLSINITDSQRHYINTNLSKTAVKKYIQQKGYRHFGQYDVRTHWHGNHIHQGKIGSWKDTVKQQDWEKTEDYLRSELIRWDYQ